MPIPAIAATKPVMPTIAAVHGVDKPINFKAAAATPAPAATFANIPTVKLAPSPIFSKTVATVKNSVAIPAIPIVAFNFVDIKDESVFDSPP